MSYKDMAKKYGISEKGLESNFNSALRRCFEHKEEFERLKKLGPYISLKEHCEEVTRLKENNDSEYSHYRNAISSFSIEISELRKRVQDLIYFSQLIYQGVKIDNDKSLRLRLTGIGDEHDCVMFLINELKIPDTIAVDYFYKMKKNEQIGHMFKGPAIVRGSIYVSVMER